MHPLSALLRLRLTALGRNIRENAAVYLFLGPLVGGVGLLLFVRVLHDLIPTPVEPATEAFVWGIALCVGVMSSRRLAARTDADLLLTLPLPASVLRLDRYLRGLFRLLPFGLVMLVAVQATGGGRPRFFSLLALLLVCALAAVPGQRPRRTLPGVLFIRTLVTRLVLLYGACTPARLRPHVRRDLLLAARGFSSRAGIYVVLCITALTATVERALSGGAQAANAGLFAVIIAAWALASLTAPLLRYQTPSLWAELDAGVPAVTLWRAKVGVGALLGLLPGMVGAAVWHSLSLSATLLCPLLGAAVGMLTGACIMEGEGKPPLHGVISLLFGTLAGAAIILFPAAALAVPAIVVYLGKLGVPRLSRHMQEAAAAL